MMKKIYTLAIVLLVLGVSSCKLGKHYSRPELRLPEQIEGTVPDSVSAGDIRWTDLYTDPVLRQLIRKTLEGNKDLMIAAAKVKESMDSVVSLKPTFSPRQRLPCRRAGIR